MPREKILIIDDEPDILTITREMLRQENFSVLTAANADEGIAQVRQEKPDLILLDLWLPGIGGKEVCRILKEDSKTASIPIIIVSGRYLKDEDVAEGLQLGADDYILKPFSSKVLLARIRAVLRRLDYSGEPEKIIKSSDGAVLINLSSHSVHIRVGPSKNQCKSVSLTPKEFDLLWFLIKKEGRVLIRHAILQAVWGFEYYGTTRTVDVEISHLRKKLAPYGKYLQTISGVGYTFSSQA